MRWFYAGPIECPDCHRPLSVEAVVCPYCCSTAPLSAPWSMMRWQMSGLILCLLAGLWLCDRLTGTALIAWLWHSLSNKV